jgi:hypothetical protein
MKTNPSRYVLVAEILTIILFHAVKIKQAEKHPAYTVFSEINKNMPLHKPVVENKSGVEYMLVNLIK